MLAMIWGYSKGVRKYYFPIGFCLLLSTIESLLTPYFISLIIDQAIANRDLRMLVTYIVVIVAISIVGCLTIIISQYLSVKLERKITLRIRQECLDHIYTQSGDFYTRADSSDLLTLLLQDVDNISDILSRQMLTLIFHIVKVIGVLFFIFQMQSRMSMVIIILVLLMIYLQKSSNSKIEKATLQSRDSVISLQSSLQELMMHLMNFVQSGLIPFQKQKISKNEHNFTTAKINAVLAMTRYQSLTSLISSIMTVTIMGWGGFNVISRFMTIGELFSFQIYAQRLISPIMGISNISAELASSSISWDRLQGVLTETSSVRDDGDIREPIQGRIEFVDVSFGYNQSNVLSDATFTIQQGSIHAIVGPSGAGKTTIIHLLYRLWEPHSGAILLDGRPIAEYALDGLREQISIVSQHIFLLNDTIYNNIVLGKENVREDEVERVLRAANLYELIHGLEEGWNTMIGENGIRLSGGEKQRLAIARAIFKNAPIMIFDEATSMLDYNTESEITETILSLFANKTVIMIAHRLSSIKNADMISVLKDGQAIEHGTHQQLIRGESFYHQLYTHS